MGSLFTLFSALDGALAEGASDAFGVVTVVVTGLDAFDESADHHVAKGQKFGLPPSARCALSLQFFERVGILPLLPVSTVGPLRLCGFSPDAFLLAFPTRTFDFFSSVLGIPYSLPSVRQCS